MYTGALLLAAVLGLSLPARGDEEKKAAACPGPGQALAMQNVVRAALGNLKQRTERIVRGEAEWRELWKRLGLPLNPSPAAPVIDFSRDMAVVVAAGEGRGVIEVEITRVESRKGCVVVSVAERRLPSAAGGSPFAGFHPFHIVRVRSKAGPVAFEYASR